MGQTSAGRHQHQQRDDVVENGFHMSLAHGPDFVHAKRSNALITGQHWANAAWSHHLMGRATEIARRIVTEIWGTDAPHCGVALRFLRTSGEHGHTKTLPKRDDRWWQYPSLMSKCKLSNKNVNLRWCCPSFFRDWHGEQDWKILKASGILACRLHHDHNRCASSYLSLTYGVFLSWSSEKQQVNSFTTVACTA